jgi:membrane dipeptidase
MDLRKSAYTRPPNSRPVSLSTMATITKYPDELERVSRRAALGQLLAAAGFAALGIGGSGAAGAQSDNASAPLADLGMDLSPEQRAAGIAFLSRHTSVDTHCHPGLFFLRDLPYETPTTRAFGAPFEERTIADLRVGQVSAALFAAVADARLLEITKTSGMHATGEFRPGEAYADYQRQLVALKSLAGSPKLTQGLDPSDIYAAQRHHRTAAVFAVEGGDFIEDRLERVHEAFRDGVRAITVVHYHVNQIGDIQTEAPVHGGLTPFGSSVIGEMNRAGVIVDLAHATFAVTKDVLEVSTRPVMISHSNLATPALNHPRLISSEHAKLVADAGGIIGSWPSGIGQKTFADYIDSIRRLVDTVGIDHVAIGTDMDANYRPVFQSYRDWGLIPAALFARGLAEPEVAKIMGGNFLRVFAAALAHAPRKRGS